MRLVFVHGRKQGGKDPRGLYQEWIGALARGIWATGLPAIAEEVEIRLPFYGDILDELTTARHQPDTVVARGPGGSPDTFQATLLAELAAQAGLTPNDIAAELQEPTVERGIANWPWVQATGRALERRAPWLAGGMLQMVMADVDTYLRRPAARRAINTLVEEAIVDNDGPIVVIGHSLGSVVAYDVLDSLRETASVPLFVTLGSPLGLDVVQQHLTHPLGMPTCVGRWLNGTDERDPIALHARLDRDAFPADIDNISDIHNRRDNPHGIDGYLGDERIARAVAQTLTGHQA